MRKLGSFLIIAGLLLQGSALAASPSPKPSAKSSAKPTAKPSAKPTAKPTAKKTPAKKSTVVHRYSPPKRVTVVPSPKPIWPPKGYAANNGVYALIPSGSQLVSLMSSKKALSTSVKQCTAMACGAVYVASDSSCNYWEVNSKVYGPNPADVTTMIEYGTLRTLAPASAAHAIIPILLISSEPLIPHESIVLGILGMSSTNFYNQIAQGKSLTQIAGSKINTLVSAVGADEVKTINVQLAAGTITADQAQALRDASSSRIATELTNYNLNVGGITVSCWTQPSTESTPSSSYSKDPNHF